VSRVLRLTLLAPDLVEAILDGGQPVGLQLDDLLEGFPFEWAEQGRQFGRVTSSADQDVPEAWTATAYNAIVHPLCLAQRRSIG
jgi:hypothetical protein